jgi:hypothetical protein
MTDWAGFSVSLQEPTLKPCVGTVLVERSGKRTPDSRSRTDIIINAKTAGRGHKDKFNCMLVQISALRKMALLLVQS